MEESIQVMSSIEVAALTGKSHSHVLRDIRTMLKDLFKSDEPYLDSLETKGILILHNQLTGLISEIRLPKREALILTSGYSIKQRAIIIDRWQELEQRNLSTEISDPQIAAMVMSLQRLDAVQRKQFQQQQQINEQTKRLNEIDAKTSAILDGSGFYSVAGFASLHGIKVDIKAAASYGRKAASESKTLGIAMGSIPDPRFGTVKTYHEDVLKHVFAIE